MSDQQWYINSDGNVFGPLTTVKLEQMFRENLIQPSDLIGVAGEETWLPASSVQEMFQQTHTSQAEESPSHAASDILGRLRTPKPAHIDEVSESIPIGALGEFVSGGAQRVTGGVAALSGGIGGLIGSAIEGLFHAASAVFRLRHSKLTLVVLGVLLAAILLRNVQFADSDNQLVFEQLVTLGDEVELMRGAQGVTADDWEHFRRVSQESLDPAIKLLSEAAGQDHPLSQSLPLPYVQSSESVVRGYLLECGYALRAMIKSQGGADDVRYAYTKNIDLARQKLSPGTVIPKPANKSLKDESFTLWIIIADVLIVAGGLFWWWRRSAKV